MNSELFLIFIYLVGVIQGGALAYLLWGRDSTFKRAFIEGLTLKIIWGRFVK